MPTIYSIDALSTGAGRDGHVTTSDGMVDLEMRAPKELGGSGEGFNPEQLFAAGYAACFHSALNSVARQRKIQLTDATVGARVELVSVDDGLQLAVHLEVVIPTQPHDVAQELADEAHQLCPYSNATRGNIQVTITVTDD
ncbi:organic hydroperoxide resistance protein [Glaciihabitans arcticus]|uniref:Organic hydroperoxide resistance protein n=1 Tax=Glaciihabitans arcticus TaxID=2668039 RepID=A0A4Q9GXF9_9MICO|nr:organic hydroperoxide resistance protein [Glaciihabitans arcticus]TBN57927.1 organic hydroperoxide resistance protein [Glaciihabitans arcticus]